MECRWGNFSSGPAIQVMRICAEYRSKEQSVNDCVREQSLTSPIVAAVLRWWFDAVCRLHVLRSFRTREQGAMRVRMLVKLQQEGLEAYRRKMDLANGCLTQMWQDITDS